MSGVQVAGEPTGQPVVERPIRVSKTSSWTVDRMIALALLVLSTILVAVLPVAGKQVTYTWDPPDSFGAAKVQLLMPATPARLTATWPCAAVRGVAPAPGLPPKQVFSTGFSTNGELTMWVDSSTMTAFLAGRPVIDASLPIPQADCTLELGYSDADRTVSLSDGTQSRSVPLKTSVVRDTDAVDAVQVTGLEVAPSLRSQTSVVVTAHPSTQQWPWSRWAIALAALSAALYLWWSFFRVSRPWTGDAPTPRWSGSDVAVAVAAGAGLFLIPPLADDGWVLTTVRAFPQLGFFSNFFTADAAAQPEGFWWTSIERIWMTPLGTSILALRIPSMVIGVLCWWYLRRRVVDQVGESARLPWLRGVCATACIAIMLAWMPTLRPEPLVGLLGVIALALVLRFRRRQDGWVLLALALVSALSFSVHQTGWIVVGVACASLPDVRRWWRSDQSAAAAAVLTSTVLFVSSALLLMMLKSNLAILMDARESFIEGGRHNAVLDEGLRVRGLLTSAATSPLRLLSAMLVPVVALGWLALVRLGWPRDTARLAAGAASLGGMFLVFTSSKWQWHFGATIGVTSCALALLADRARKARGTAIGFVITAAVLGLLATIRAPGWGLQDLRVVNPDQPVLGSLTRALVWLAVAALVFWFARRRRRPGAAAIGSAVLAVVGIVAASSVGPLVVDGVRAPKTSWPALVARSAAPGNCGLASAMRVPTVTSPLAKVVDQPPTDTLLESTWGTDQTLPIPPVPDVSTLRPAGSFSIPVTTPWYLLEPGVPARTWIHFKRPGPLSYSVEWRRADGSSGSTGTDRQVLAPSWALVPLDVPDDATRVRVTWLNSPDIDVAVSPVAVSATAPVTALASDPVLRTPASALYAPCFSQPDISSGSMQQFSMSLGLPFIGQSTAATGVGVFSEQNCLDNVSSQAYPPLCWYGVVTPSADGLRTTTAIADR